MSASIWSRALPLIAACIFASCVRAGPAPAPPSRPNIDAIVRDEMRREHVPGVAVAVYCRGAVRIVEVSEDEIAGAVRALFDDSRQVAEGAGAAPLAALVKERERMSGKRVGLILSGGNIERARFLAILNGETPRPEATGCTAFGGSPLVARNAAMG